MLLHEAPASVETRHLRGCVPKLTPRRAWSGPGSDVFRDCRKLLAVPHVSKSLRSESVAVYNRLAGIFDETLGARYRQLMSTLELENQRIFGGREASLEDLGLRGGIQRQISALYWQKSAGEKLRLILEGRREEHQKTLKRSREQGAKARLTAKGRARCS